VSIQHTVIYEIYISKWTMGKLTVHLHILSLQLFDHTKSVPQHL